MLSDSGNSVMCQSCSQVKSLGIFTERGEHFESAFVDGSVKDCKTAKTLLKKVDKHRDSASHNKALQILASSEEDLLGNSVRNAQTNYEERHKHNIDATEKVFRTAYECGKWHL